MSSINHTHKTKTGTKRSRSVGPSVSSRSSDAATNEFRNNNDDAKSSVPNSTIGATSTKSSQHTTQLSGATRNMRFMQRNSTGNIKSVRHSYPPTASQPTKERNICHDNFTNSKVDDLPSQQEKKSDATNDRKSNNSNSENSYESSTIQTTTLSTTAPTSTNNNNVNVPKYERITTSFDMYGGNILIGRRSFNGMNAITASNYYLHQKALNLDIAESTTNNKKKKKKTYQMDESEQQRYEELANDIRKEESRNDRRNSATVSNTKRGGGRNMISNHKKKDLDDILKFVNS